jgi:hypothetical protein
MKKPFVITLFFVVLAIHPAEGQEKYLLPGTWSDGPEDRLAENEFTFFSSHLQTSPTLKAMPLPLSVFNTTTPAVAWMMTGAGDGEALGASTTLTPI